MRCMRKMSVVCAALLMVFSLAWYAFAASPGSEPPSTHTPQEIAFPDIKAMEFVADRLSPQPGEIVFFKGTYVVTGCVKKPFFGKITLDGNTLIEQEMKNYNPDCVGSTMFDGLFGVSWKASPGTHTVVFTADSKNDISEGQQNELNNTQTMTITVPLRAIDKIKGMKTKQPIPVPVPGVR